ncbi:hypothetical protein ACIRSU_20295 [Streptomyces sp. NPDC101160]|uniref:hypothetical protein n=1 Tax=Streptomyces sp. NPDC101160 TaxID=3366118 RepID=UPI00381BE937
MDEAGGARALDVPATATALDRYGTQARGWVAGGVVAAVAGGWMAAASADSVWGGQVGPGLLTLGVLVAAVSLGTLVTARRMRRVLAARPWSAHPAELVPQRGRLHPATVVLTDPATGETWPLALRAAQQRHHLAQPGPTGVLWWCGDPARGGVLAQPGGGTLVWAVPVLRRNARRSLVRRAADDGLLVRPVPAQPQGVAPVPAPVRATVRPADLTYGLLAPYAWTPKSASGKKLRRRRPEADVRSVPWWRVRSLRRLSGLPSIGLSALLVLAMGALWCVQPTFKPVITGAIALVGTGWYGYRFLTFGRHVAALFARAAAAPALVPKRYVLLRTPRGNGPLLVVFPADGGPDARPLGVLPLRAEDVPDAPLGQVELRGWLDRSTTGRPIVVPWVGGRALWPMEAYLEAGTDRFAEVMAPPASVIPLG